MSEYKINRDSIKHLLETPPCVGVDITETPMTLVEKAAKTFVERKHEYIMECIVKADIDPDALIKTAKKNQELMEELAELYKKIENGTLVEFPCKVGQTIFFYTCVCDKEGEEKFDILEGEVISFSLQKEGLWGYCRYKCGLTYWHLVENDFGKTVFLTREEAERALERREG